MAVSGGGRMRLIPVHYLGFTAMDRRFSSPMLPWIVSEIRRRDSYEKLSLGVEDGILQAYNADFELQFAHKVQQVFRFSQADLDPCTFLYLLKEDTEKLLNCYLFQAAKATDVSDLYQQMKDQSRPPPPTRTVSSASSLTSLSLDISPSSSNFFEVLYIGKIKVWNRKVPDTFIDDALEKFKIHEQEKSKNKSHGPLERLRSFDTRRGSVDSTGSCSSNESGPTRPPLQRSSSALSGLTIKSPEIERNPLCEHTLLEDESTEKSASVESLPQKAKFSRQVSFDEIASSEAHGMRTPVVVDDHNRTMVLQVGRSDLRLISPDRKVILLHKQHKDITTCVHGMINSEHFGFIAREVNTMNTYIGYIFKCESQSVANEAVGAITQAFGNADAKPLRPAITSCEHCPMVWYHKLCAEIEHLTDRKTQAAIFRRLDQLDDEEQSTILTKFRGAETDSLREQNEFLMMLLRAHCEMKQGRHVHDTAENRSEFLNQYLGGGTIFMKAKRSLTNSFDHLLKRKASKDDFNPILRDMTLPLNRESSPHSIDNSDRESEGMRSRSSTIGSASDLKETHLVVPESKHALSPDRTIGSDKGLKSPMIDIFMKVGSPKSNTSEEGSPKMDTGSWRQAIFKRVVTPSKQDSKKAQKRSKEELQILWRKAIHQAILLVRMEKENAKIKARQEETAVKRIKLEYEEMRSNQRETLEVWELITSKESKISLKCDKQMLLQAIKQGIPRTKRGEVWQFLAEQFSHKTAPIDSSKFPNYNVPYENLLKLLTSHQHAILIDLGRTFPSHSYYSSPMGPGQLALFNLLKAYSLLDPEVGYCQGLSFVAGVLLLHMEESQAFYLLRHLMFKRGLRKQYLPDMIGLQIKLYQLSRLLHDQLPELYNHFDFYEVAPTLYAAPWILTIFASQFQLGFVSRVFDLVFSENTDVIFRVALALLTHHKDSLLACDSFEEIMNYLKNKLPAIDKATLDQITKQIFITDIAKQLNEYQVEYMVLQEEMTSVQPQVDALRKLEGQNKALTEQNKALMAQLELALSNVQRLEKNRTLQQSSINRLEMQSRGLEVTITTLGAFVNALVEEKADVEIPDEVRRIISQISFSERRKSELRQNNLMKMLGRDDAKMVKSLSTGKLVIPDLRAAGDSQRSNSLNAQSIQELSAQKKSHFFSSSHNQILQQKVHAQNCPKIDIKVQECVEVSPTSSLDSGVGTPSSPKEADVHPLSNCDVQFTYNGTRELKTIKNLRNVVPRNSSPDVVSK